MVPSGAAAPKRKSRAGWWLAGIALVLMLLVGGCIVAVAISGGVGTDLSELRDDCDGGDMSACDDLFRRAPVGSDDEFFGNTCGLRTEVPLQGGCASQFGPFVN
jgi:hypothetical protein